MRDVTFSLVITPSLDREMFSGSVDAGFVLALLFCHGDLEPDCVGVLTRGGGGGGLMHGIKIPLQDCPLNMQGGLCASGDVFAGHYGICS